ncbi:chromosomal replication initiator protein DnaA [Bombella sp. ESL0380]|nr:chromosomal replication initiator protein DnaA [Bombella sp. ESL0380]
MEKAQSQDAAMASSENSALKASWLRICDRLKGEVGDVEYRMWIQRITLGPLDDDEITLYLPERFLRDWVRAQYGQRLQSLWREENPAVQHVELRIDKKAQRAAKAGDDAPQAEEGGGAANLSISAMANEDAAALDREEAVAATSPSMNEVRNDLAVPLDRRFTFDNFVVGKPNEFAYACAGRVADHPASPGFNPLFLYGGVGLGKTHLMHAIGLKLISRGNISVAYMSAEKFMYRFIASMQSKSQMEFKEQLRSVDVLMIDDLQFLIGKNSTQEEFFHTFNALVDAGRQIIVSADKSPSDLSGLEDRLRTRLGCGMVADIHATTFELRISILEAKAKASGTPVPPKVLEYLAHKITTNVRELEGALNRLIAHADLVGRPVTLESTQDVLKDMLKAHERRVTIDEIQRKVAEHFNIRLTDMSSARRARAVARPRQIAMYLAKQLTSRSLPEIGRKFGNRDHTTVMHAVNRISELMEQDPGLAESVELLRHMLES